MQHVQTPTDGAQLCHHPMQAVKGNEVRPCARHLPQIDHFGAQKRKATRFRLLMEHHHCYLVTPGEALGEIQERRDHCFPSAAVEAARRNQSYPHDSLFFLCAYC
jgi:hypothetical protein